MPPKRILDNVTRRGILLGPDGRPISSDDIQNKKADAPITGNAFGDWAGRDVQIAKLPGGGVVQFDLSKLTVDDFAAMRDHYQVNASLSILSFMQHQSDYHIECDDPKIAAAAQEMMDDNWTQINKVLAQANWAGYSPGVLEWDNNLQTRSVDLGKVKDLIPQECRVNWKIEQGWAPPGRTPPNFKTFDGILQGPALWGSTIPNAGGWPIPVDNSFWYPLLMENGDYYGRKLLRPAFQSWFFSILLHLFANRYYERFGEPTPIGRAPFDEQINSGGESVRGDAWMLGVLQQLRNRSVVVLPNDMHQMSETKFDYDYDIEYLESQMRGADFERYMTRLDEEISIGLFTPILLLRTADVGSYNLGTQHTQTYQLMINAMNGDRKVYIDKYILSKWTDYNFSPNAPRPKIVFTKLGQANLDILQAILTALVTNGSVTIDLEEAGQALGMTLKQVRQTTKPAPAPENDPANDPNAPSNRGRFALANRPEACGVRDEIVNRVRGQVTNAWRDEAFGEGYVVNMGFKNRMQKAFTQDGTINPSGACDQVYDHLDSWLEEVVKLGSDGFESADAFVDMFERVLSYEITQV